MNQPTLDEFIAAYGTRTYRSNLYVKEKGFKQLYVRMTPRLIVNKWWDPTLDLANIEATRPGKGTFTRLVEHLRREHPALTFYVEVAPDKRFQAHLLAMGFAQVKPELVMDCFYLLPTMPLVPVLPASR